MSARVHGLAVGGWLVVRDDGTVGVLPALPVQAGGLAREFSRALRCWAADLDRLAEYESAGDSLAAELRSYLQLAQACEEGEAPVPACVLAAAVEAIS